MNAVQYHTNVGTCCSRTQGADRADWFSPTGEQLPFDFDLPLYEMRTAQRVDLYRRGDGATSGIYHCLIPAASVTHTIFIGLYLMGGIYNYTHQLLDAYQEN